MPTYEVELEDGKVYEVEADSEPSHDDVYKALGVQTTPQPTEEPKEPAWKSILRPIAQSFVQSPIELQQNVAKVPELAAKIAEPIQQTASDVASDFLRRTGIDPSAMPGRPIIEPVSIEERMGPEEFTRLPKSVQALVGFHDAMERTASGFTEPGQAALLPVLGTKPAQAIIAAQSLAGAPEVGRRLGEAKTPSETTGALTEGAINALIGAGVGSHLLPRELRVLPKASQAALETIKERTEDASQVSPTAEVHGDVPPLAVEGQGQVPVKEGSQGVQPQAEVGVTPEVPLESTEPSPTVPKEPTPAPEATIAPKVEEQPPVPGVGPGMGGALAKGELADVGAGGEKYGISQAVREERAKAGQVESIQPGQGTNPLDSVERGRELNTANPAAAEELLTKFEQDPQKSFSADLVAATRARGEELAVNARRIEEQFGTESPEYQAASKALSEWDKRTKPVQTEWHKVGMAQQGWTDLDTGSFTGLEREFRNQTGKDFNEPQKEKATRIASSVRDSEAETVKAAKEVATDVQTHAETAPPLEKPVWETAKKYLGEGDRFDDVVNKTATDLGIPAEQVIKTLAKSKKMKRSTDDLWAKQLKERQLKEKAKRWVAHVDEPKYEKFLRSLPRSMFAIRVGFHGTVALGTHAPAVAFQPPFWSTYIKDFGKMYKMVGSPSYYEQQVQNLVRRKNYNTANRAGLVVDPFKYEDFNNPDMAQYFGRLSGMGNRGYFILKVLRQDMFDQHWNGLPKDLQVPEVAKAIADNVNHITGVVKAAAPTGANVLLFAPRLEMSRAAFIFGDPIRMVRAFANWNNVDAGEKVFAMKELKSKAWVAGTMFGLLALNQGMLSATGSKQKINLTDPFKSDWMKFKVAGMNVSYGNPLLTMSRIPIRVTTAAVGSGGKLKNLIYPDEDIYKMLGEYGRSQLSPFASLIADQITREDYARRQLGPGASLLGGSNRPMPKRLRMQDIGPYDWKEYWVNQGLPIPFQEGVREVWKYGLGMSDKEMKHFGKAFLSTVFQAGTGGRVAEDIPYGQPGPYETK